MPARPSFKSIAEYIAAQPAHARPVLARVRSALRKALPRATEGISYQIPVYKVDGRMVLYFAGFQSHYSIYPATGRLIDELAEELDGLLHSKATLRFSYADAVPTRLITRIAKLRAAEASERATSKVEKSPPKKKRPRS